MLKRHSTVLCILLQLTLNVALASDFVRVRGTQFIHKGKPFRFLGTNAYFLLQEASVGNWKVVEDVYRQAQAAHMTVVRTWAFNDIGEKGNTLQLSPGVYDEQVFRALDFVVAKASEYNLKLIFVLTNNWSDYGGIHQYVKWSPTAQTHDDFFTDASCQHFYQQYVSQVLKRRNTLTKVVYKDDPTIMAWELINEPTSNDASGRIVQRWLDVMSAYVKSIDNNHLVGTGEAGFDNNFVGYNHFLSSVPLGDYRLHWLVNGAKGVSFTMNLQLPHIDYAGSNIYPDQYNISVFQAVQILRDRKTLASQHQKPFVVTELGKRMNRLAAYQALLGSLFEFGAAGVCIWQLAAPASHDAGRLAVRMPEDSDVVSSLRKIGTNLSSRKPLPPFSFPRREQRFPLILFDDGRPTNAELLLDRVVLEEDTPPFILKAQGLRFADGGSVEVFPRGIISLQDGTFLRLWIRVPPDSGGDLWIETHVRGQWLSSYRTTSPFWQLIDIPLSDLGIQNDFLERLKLYSPAARMIAIAKIEILGGKIATTLQPPEHVQWKRLNSQIHLSWKHGKEKNILGYKVYRSTNTDSRYFSKDLYAFSMDNTFVDSLPVPSPMVYSITAVGFWGEESRPRIVQVE